MKVTLKKILGAAALALAATFFAGTLASCDNGTTPGTNTTEDDPSSGTEDGGEIGSDPASEVKWEFATEGTITRIAIELDENIKGEKKNAVTDWTNIKFYGWAEKDGLDKTEPLGNWGGTKPQLIEEEGAKTIAYVNIPAAATPKTEPISIIVNGSAGEEDDQLTLGSIKAGEQKIYKIVGEGEEAACALVDWTEAEEQGAVAEGEESEVAVVPGKIKIGISSDYYKIANWEAVAIYVYGDTEVLGSWPGTVATLDETLGIYTVEVDVEGDSWNVIFNNNNGGKQFDAGKINKDETKLYTHEETWITWDGESADSTSAITPPSNLRNLQRTGLCLQLTLRL